MWIGLSKQCVGGIVAHPEKDGTWCWVVDGTQWRHRTLHGFALEVWRKDKWVQVWDCTLLNAAVAFSLGWRARNQFPAELPVTLPAVDVAGE